MKSMIGITRGVIAVTSTAAMLLPFACAHVKVDPIEVKTIHIVHDINIKVDRELDQFFAFQEKGATTAPATTQAVTPTAQTPGGVQ